MRYFSMFSGIGGFELGIQRAMPDAECVGFSEIDKYAISVYQHHFGGHEPYGNARTIDLGRLPAFDLLVGGFPCQAFSIAGKRLGFDDTRGTLFFDIARILKHKRPRHLVLENVKGLLSDDGGKTFTTILGVLADLGYYVEWQVLNSAYYDVPQNRERIYIVGHLGGAPRRKVFPITGASAADTSARGEPREVARTLRSHQGGVDIDDQLVCEAGVINRGAFKGTGKTALTVTANYYKGHDNHGQRPMVKVREATKTGYAEATVGDSINISVPTSSTRRGRVQRGLAGTLQTGENQATLTSDARIRRLTPLECERLQGFPDDWTAEGVNGPISDTQRYKMCGNAVTVNVVKAVMEHLV